MFLSTLVKNPVPRPKLGKSGMLVSKLRPVSETSSTDTAATFAMSSTHSRISHVVGGGDWGAFERPNDDPWQDSDGDSFGFGGDDAGDGFGDDDDWNECSVAPNSNLNESFSGSVTSFTSESRKTRTPTASRGKALNGSRHRPASSPKTAATVPFSGNSDEEPKHSGPSSRTWSSLPEATSSRKEATSSRKEATTSSTSKEGKGTSSRNSLKSLSQSSTHSRSCRSKGDSDDRSVSSRSQKAPMRSFRTKPASANDDDASVGSKQSISRSSAHSSTRPSGSPRSASRLDSSSHRRIPPPGRSRPSSDS